MKIAKSPWIRVAGKVLAVMVGLKVFNTYIRPKLPASVNSVINPVWPNV